MEGTQFPEWPERRPLCSLPALNPGVTWLEYISGTRYNSIMSTAVISGLVGYLGATNTTLDSHWFKDHSILNIRGWRIRTWDLNLGRQTSRYLWSSGVGELLPTSSALWNLEEFFWTNKPCWTELCSGSCRSCIKTLMHVQQVDSHRSLSHNLYNHVEEHTPNLVLWATEEHLFE